MKKTASPAYFFDADRDACIVPSGSIINTMSDLHIGMYDRPAVAGGRQHAMTETQIDALVTDSLARSDHLVLAGDVFESVYLPPNITIDTALQNYALRITAWLEHTKDTGGVLHLIAGNHDSNPELIQMLEALSETHADRLHVHPVALHINDTLFVHGDNVKGRHLPNATERFADSETGVGAHIVAHLPDIIKPAARHLFADVKSHVQPLWQQAVNHLNHAKYRAALYEHLFDSDLLKPVVQTDGTMIPAVTNIHSGHTHLLYFDETPPSDAKTHMFNAGTLADTRQFQPHTIHITEQGTTVSIDERASKMAKDSMIRVNNIMHQGMIRPPSPTISIS